MGKAAKAKRKKLPATTVHRVVIEIDDEGWSVKVYGWRDNAIIENAPPRVIRTMKLTSSGAKGNGLTDVYSDFQKAGLKDLNDEIAEAVDSVSGSCFEVASAIERVMLELE